MRALTLLVLLFAFSVPAVSQQLSNQAKAQQVAAAFTRNKHGFKEKFGVRFEEYKHVRSEPLVRTDIRDYSGAYEVPELEFVINIQVGSDGSVKADGADQMRPFRFENATIEGAVLAGTKVYKDGSRERFEGVFLKRIDRISPADPGMTTFGLGVVLDAPLQRGSLMYDKLFYQLKQ